jgi:4-diphosphocytidyl-2-C-methyl-D-erythritol kinase
MSGNKGETYLFHSYAKINWFLSIEGLRPDGYHNIASLMQQIELHDELYLSLSSEDSFTCNYAIPLGEDSLLWRTVTTLRETFPRLRQYHFAVRVKKVIPPGGGLGGASSNVATLLRFLPTLGGYSPSFEEMLPVALSLGSDIPFFLRDAPFALVEGRGERVVPLSFSPRRFLVLLFPSFPISTSLAYKKWDEKRTLGFSLGGPARKLLRDFLERGDPEGVEGVVWNDFETVLFEIYPLLKKYRDMLLDLGCRQAFLTGSGSTLVGVVEGPEEGERIVEGLQKMGIQALCTVTRCLQGGNQDARRCDSCWG